MTNIVVQSPYGDDQTRSKEISKMLEEFIEEKWDQTATSVPVTDIAFGKYGDQLLQSGKDITLRAYSFFEDARRMNTNGSRWAYTESHFIDIYVLNNEDDSARDPRAVKIKKWLEGLFIVYQGNMLKGIYEVDFKGARMDSDPITTNITRVKVHVDVIYILDVVSI